MFRDTVAPLAPDTHPGIVTAMADGAALAHKDLRAALELGRALERRAATGGDDRRPLRRGVRARQAVPARREEA